MKNFDELHMLACKQGKDTYIDPSSGYQVLTSEALLKKGKCCGNSCRHCPYGHINVERSGAAQVSIKKHVIMNLIPMNGAIDVLFWSGGKDSFLTLNHLLEEGKNVVLLTSFGALTSRVSIQDIHIKDISKQSEFFKVPLCLVPLQPNSDYKQSIEEGLELIRTKTGAYIQRLVFGDLHLKDIRQWRVETWSGYEVATPLFDLPYGQLFRKLWKLVDQKNLSISLSTDIDLPDASTIPVGTPYTPELVERFKTLGIDAILENGEGHTFVFPR
jgi:ATP-binding cassette subfamily B (MDR/TAP) protein 1